MCECVCVEAAGSAEEAERADEDLKTRTPHNDVGNKNRLDSC